MSTSSAAPIGVGGGVGLDQGTMPAPMGPGGGPATQSSVGVPNMKDLQGVLGGLTNMLGKTPKERETNAKALAATVKDIGGLASTMSETTLMQRMMEAQGSGLGFVEGSPGGAISPVQPPAVGQPIMAQMGFTGR